MQCFKYVLNTISTRVKLSMISRRTFFKQVPAIVFGIFIGWAGAASRYFISDKDPNPSKLSVQLFYLYVHRLSELKRYFSKYDTYSATSKVLTAKRVISKDNIDFRKIRELKRQDEVLTLDGWYYSRTELEVLWLSYLYGMRVGLNDPES